jgi:hypothetical protein
VSDRERMQSTIAIWAAFAAIMITIIAALAITGVELALGESILLVVVIVLLAATVVSSTQAVWGSKEGEADRHEARLAKPKRAARSRVERLVEMLDDDEIYDLETLLLARDEGELRDRQQT